MRLSKNAASPSHSLPSHLLMMFVGVCIGRLLSTGVLQELARPCFHHDEDSGMAPSSSSTRQESNNHNGWSMIHVFYGTQSQLPTLSDIRDKKYLTCKTWFAQARQDELVAALHRNKTNGFFIDIAANDAIRLSSTLGLERNLNWKGICIEANPKYWMGLAARNCQVVGAVVGNDQDEVPFSFSRNEFGGIVGFDNKKNAKTRATMLKTVTLLEVFQRLQAPHVIDFMSLDVEGAEGIVLQQPVLDQYRFRLITVERPKGNLKQLLQDNGYVMIKKVKSWGETLWAHSSFEHELDKSALDMDTESYNYTEGC